MDKRKRPRKYAFFLNEFAQVTDVGFDDIGEYVLRLTAFDGLLEVFDETVVSVFPDNSPPIVDAGPDQVLIGTRAWVSLTCTTTIKAQLQMMDCPIH